MNTEQKIKKTERRKRNRGIKFFNECAELLHCFHQGMNLFNPENETPDYETHRRTTTNITRTEDFVHKTIEREVFTYDPNSPDTFSALQTQKKEIKNYPLFGIKLVSIFTTHLIRVYQFEVFIQVNELFLSCNGEALQQVSGNITVQIQLANN